MKKCSKCGLEQEISFFHRQKTKPDGRHSWCKVCRNLMLAEYRENNRESIKERQRVQQQLRRKNNPDAVKNSKLREAHNISLEDYKRVLKEQDGKCAICGDANGRIDPRTGRPMMLSVDHDHTCCDGKNSCGSCFRGLLCNRCNMGLGHFNDDLQLMTRAIEYLTQSL